MTTPVTIGNNRVLSGVEGYNFATDHEILTILANIVVASDDHDGVNSIYSNSVLINRGFIFSDQSNGVEFSSATVDSRITNAFGALIVGAINGVEMDGSGSQIFNNNGKVISSAFDGFQAGEAAIVNNHGLISGLQSGVDFRNATHASTSVLNNYGNVQSDNKGIRIETFVNDVNTVINNYTSGIIKGLIYSIYSDLSMFTLTNLGRIVGTIIDEANVHDTVINHGLIQGVLKLQGGNDVFNGSGGTSGPVFGGDGNDHLAGGPRADRLHGGANNDTLTGQLGADRFFFDTALNSTTMSIRSPTSPRLSMTSLFCRERFPQYRGTRAAWRSAFPYWSPCRHPVATDHLQSQQRLSFLRSGRKWLDPPANPFRDHRSPSSPAQR